MIRVLYAGSPEASAKTLSLLFDGADGYEIAGVLSNPPSAQGRHKTPVSTPSRVLPKSAAFRFLRPNI